MPWSEADSAKSHVIRRALFKAIYPTQEIGLIFPLLPDTQAARTQANIAREI